MSMACKCDKEYRDSKCDTHGDNPKPVQKVNKTVTKIDKV